MWKRAVVAGSVIVCVAALEGCEADPPSDGGDADAAPDAAPDTAAPTDAAPDGAAEVVPAEPLPVPAIVWSPCDELEGRPRDGVDCANVLVPIDWAAPGGPLITLFVKRVRALEEPADGAPRRALWLLMGGPGQAGSDGEGLVRVLGARDPELDFYLADHRGTGKSSRLACPVQEGPLSQGGLAIIAREWPACRDAIVATWGDGLRHFSTTQAAHDVAALIGAVHPARDHVIVIGISYGTYLGSRYLQIADQHEGGLADGVVLDSLCPPDGCRLSRSDLEEDLVARQIMDRCADDTACRARFPGGRTAAWDALGELYEQLASGHCPIAGHPEVEAELLRSALGDLMFGFAGRRAAPALVHRMRRCAPGDVAAIRHLYRRTFGYDPGAGVVDPDLPPAPIPFGGGFLVGYSWPLAINILVSELWEASDPSPEELVRRWQTTRSCRGVGRQASWQIPGWPRYADPLVARYAETSVPVLAMNADLDPATPAVFARLAEPHLDAPHQRYVEIPGAAHAVIAQGQLLSDPASTCGRELLLQFIDDPRAELDTSCLADTMPLGFSMSGGAVDHFFGTTDMWGDDAGGDPALP